jgi:hypothetical protein
MGATGAFLSDVQVLVEVDDTIRAGINAISMPGAFLRVDDYYPVFPFVYCVALTGWDAWCFIAVHAQMRPVGHPDFGNGAPDFLKKLHPKLAGIRLRLGIGSPVVAHMLVLAYYLAAVTTVTYRQVYNKYFHLLRTPFNPGIET